MQISLRLTIDRVSFFGSSSFSAGHTLLIGETIRVPPPPLSLFGCTTYTIRAGRNLSASRPYCYSPSHSLGKLIPVCPFVFSLSLSLLPYLSSALFCFSVSFSIFDNGWRIVRFIESFVLVREISLELRAERGGRLTTRACKVSSQAGALNIAGR